MKADIYQEVTSYIINALEKVEVSDYKAPFAQLFSDCPPMNPTTGSHYRGINTVFLWCVQSEQNFESNEWATYQQWKGKGAQVKKGQAASRIIYYKRVEKNGVEQINTQDEKGFYNMLKTYSVFNADQVEGYESESSNTKEVFGTVQKIDEIEQFITKTKAVIETGTKASFSPTLDKITMPEERQFFDGEQNATENYYAVLLHELTHWTGGKARLKREQSTSKNNPDYAFEELIAELGAAFLCAKFGIKQQARDDHAIYIKSWLNSLKNDNKHIFKASALAQKAVDYLDK